MSMTFTLCTAMTPKNAADAFYNGELESEIRLILRTAVLKTSLSSWTPTESQSCTSPEGRLHTGVQATGYMHMHTILLYYLL